MNQLDEYQLIHRAQEGDLEAFNLIVLEYQALVYNHALWLVSDPYAAEDITQETFLSAFEHLNQYRGGSFRAWLLRIATNDGIDELRRCTRRKAQPLVGLNQYGEENENSAWIRDPACSVEDIVEQKVVWDWLKKYIDELPEEYRSSILLVDLCELKYAEASAVLNVPIGTVKSRLARARFYLQKRLKEVLQMDRDLIFESV